LFVKTSGKGNLLIVSLYVDDLIFTRDNAKMVTDTVFKDSMKKEFDMTDLGKMSNFLGAEIVQNDKGIFINQSDKVC